MKKIKVGIIGQGHSGLYIHRHLLEDCAPLAERFEVVAVADPIEERRANPSHPSCRQYADYKEMLKDRDMELVINASRSHQHVDISIEAMRAGYGVVCEKPLAGKVSEVDHVLAAQKETGRFFAVFQQARFRPMFQKICEVIRSGVLGDIAMVKVAYDSFGRRWDWQTIQGLNGGELMNTVPHPLDQMIALWDIFGESEPEQVFCKLARFSNMGDAEDFVKLVLSGKGHPVIDLEVTRQCLFPGKVYQVFGANGSLYADANEVQWKYYVPAEAAPRTVRLETMEQDKTRLPIYCFETLNFYTGKWEVPDFANTFDDWGTRYYLNIYEAITAGAPLVVKLSQVRRQVALIEKCRLMNPLEKTVVVPEGIF